MGAYKAQHNRCENAISVAVDPWESADAANLNRFLFSIWIYRIICVILAAIFLWSGVAKMYNPREFTVIIEAYGILAVGILIPALEIILAAGLLFGIRGILGGITGLLLLFMVVPTYGERNNESL